MFFLEVESNQFEQFFELIFIEFFEYFFTFRINQIFNIRNERISNKSIFWKFDSTLSWSWIKQIQFKLVVIEFFEFFCPFKSIESQVIKSNKFRINSNLNPPLVLP